MIRRFYVDNFRCLVNFEFKPDQINLLVGANGAGKSTLFDALQAVRLLASGVSVTNVFHPGLLPWWDRRSIHAFELDYADPEDGRVFRYRLKVRYSGRSGPPLVEEEDLALEGRPLLSFAEGRVKIFGEDRPLFDLAFNGTSTPLSSGLGETPLVQRFRLSLADISIFKINPWSIGQNSTNEERGLMPDASNFASWLRGVMLEDPGAFTRFQTIVTQAMPRLRSVRLHDLGGGSRFLLGVVSKVGGGEATIPFVDFSEGEKCLCVLSAIAARRHVVPVLALDEPDNFLSIVEVQQALRNLIEPHERGRSQVFVISHHPESIDYLAPDSTWLFERPINEHVRLRRLTFDLEKGETATETVKAELR